MASQHIILDALIAHAEQVLDPEQIAVAWDNEPQSHVFVPNHDDGPWDEDDVTSIQAVGAQDVAAKVRYWSNVIDAA
ncbi:hypothetical protein SEA_MARGARET_34 [Gordonia phage Margaret]|nr:hypothetical protein SEA_MARGARET_34 [Gordonia phage Margaret]